MVDNLNKNTNMYYTGIGSRDTPQGVLRLMSIFGVYFGKLGYILRSGASDGADRAFEKGADYINAPKEIYLPWKGFNNHKSNLILKDKKAIDIAKNFHPYWYNLNNGARKLQARNSYQVLGKDLNCPSSFIICYTPGGKGLGGTGQAIRIARNLDIPVLDIGNYKNDDELRIATMEFFSKYVEGYKDKDMKLNTMMGGIFFNGK